MRMANAPTRSSRARIAAGAMQPRRLRLGATLATYRARVAFNLKGLHPHEHNVDLDAGEQRSEAFLKINPLGAIPALIDRGAGQTGHAHHAGARDS